MATLPAGTRVTLVHSANARRASVRLPVVIAALELGAVLCLIEGDAGDRISAAVAAGAPASVVAHGAAYPTTIRQVNERWIRIDPPVGAEVTDGRSQRRFPVSSMSGSLVWADRHAAVHVVDLSVRGAKLLVEWDEAYRVGRSFDIELLGRRGAVSIRRVEHEPPSLLAWLGVQFVERDAELLVGLLRAVGEADAATRR